MSSGISELMQTLFPDIVKRSPPEAARGLMIAAGMVYFALNYRERRRIEESVGDLLGPVVGAEEAKRRVFGHILEHYFEKLLVANRTRRFTEDFVRGRVAVEGLEALDRAIEGGRGALAVTAHWGAVELIPPLLAARGYPLSIVLEAKTPRLRSSLEGLASGRDVELIIASRGDRVLERIFSSLARGRVLVTQVDEVDAWRRRKSKTINVFGKSLFFDHSIDFIAKRSGARAVGLSCRREGSLRYSLRCEGLADDPSATDVSVAALRFWERQTLEAPEQWYQWKKWSEMKADA